LHCTKWRKTEFAKTGGVNRRDGTYDGVETGCGRTNATVVYVFRKALVSADARMDFTTVDHWNSPISSLVDPKSLDGNYIYASVYRHYLRSGKLAAEGRPGWQKNTTAGWAPTRVNKSAVHKSIKDSEGH
jgi:hypothetical protein